MTKPNHELSPALIVLMSIATGLAVASNYYAQPLLDTIARNFSLSASSAGFIVTAAQLGYAAGLLFLVPLGDMFERRRLIVSMTLLAAGGMLITASSQSLAMMILGTALTGLFSVVAQILVPLAATLASPDKRGKVVGTIMSGLLLAAGSSLWVAALTVMAMDVRHVLYGPSLRSRIIQRLQKSKTALWAFGLTDEVFAAATAKLVRNNRRWSENWMIGIAFSSWSSWVFGTVIGAFSGSGLLQGYPAVEAALGFMLPALFMSFLLASFQRKQSLCVTAALVGALAGVTLFSIPVAILAGIVCGCLTALIQAFWQGAPDEL
ncbi:MFS transporter [Escherichia coli]|nr:MFS transporter [Escherichia coli]MBC6511570.1 MFS transporter [Escherichia coli]